MTGEDATAVWRPIDTAPKDGSYFLAYCATDQHPQTHGCWWRSGAWQGFVRPHREPYPAPDEWHPTHWTPINPTERSPAEGT